MHSLSLRQMSRSIPYFELILLPLTTLRRNESISWATLTRTTSSCSSVNSAASGVMSVTAEMNVSCEWGRVTVTNRLVTVTSAAVSESAHSHTPPAPLVQLRGASTKYQEILAFLFCQTLKIYSLSCCISSRTPPRLQHSSCTPPPCRPRHLPSSVLPSNVK